ncbi:MAG TPA: glycosyl hydrolase, partial [Acetivibrio sp.]|nr:glycosyl hydrolase [Acetivibrio sp.]
ENIPVIFRPFHEAEGYNNTDGSGAWFWWGSGGAEVFKELWKLLYTTLTEEYGLHNLIWEVNLYTYANSFEWYPGDEYVDIVAYDKYEGSPYKWGTSAASTIFLTLVDYTNDTKMVAMSENDTIPDIQNIVNEGAWWLYFCPWYGDFILSSSKNDPKLLNTIYNSEYVISLDELPKDLYEYDDSPAFTYGDLDGDSEINSTDLTMLKRFILKKLKELGVPEEAADLDGDGEITSTDLTILKRFILRKIKDFPVNQK